LCVGLSKENKTVNRASDTLSENVRVQAAELVNVREIAPGPALLNRSARQLRRCAMRAYLLGMILAVGALSLAGCGTTAACRAGSTGLAGAAGGAALGAIGGNAGLGALVGGLTGAAAGGLTSRSQLYAGPSPFCF
jgi:osmotically inducible lipoprotein OsmB